MIKTPMRKARGEIPLVCDRLCVTYRVCNFRDVGLTTNFSRSMRYDCCVRGDLRDNWIRAAQSRSSIPEYTVPDLFAKSGRFHPEIGVQIRSDVVPARAARTVSLKSNAGI